MSITKEMIIEAAAQLAKSEPVNHPFKVWVEKMQSGNDYGKDTDPVEKDEFDNKADAKKYIRLLMKKYDLKHHAGHIVNYEKFLELFTNF